ncbi:MAG TPA: hypothetical protein VFL99_14400 [Segeticoccus sp.]|nr:hypothetical protein [Segeticoccus sp.]HET8601514.1 hypothetical protein [Segeticoccus sp.]
MTEITRAPRRRRLLRPAVLAPALGAAVAAAIAFPSLTGGTPAYAVTTGGDGLVHITINEAKDPKRLQEDLRAMGVNVVVDYIPMGKRCSPQPRSEQLVPREQASLSVFPAPEGYEDGFTIDPKVIKPGQTGVLEFSVGDGTPVVAGIWAGVSDGPVADCTLVDSTEAPLGPPRS